MIKKRPCSTPGCFNLAKRSKCGTCRSRELKLNHPHAYHFNLLRCNANRRGIEFSISLNDFKEFCFETEYMQKKGKRGKALTVDRIRDTEGYVRGNLQALPHNENSRKLRVVYDHFAEKKFSTRTVSKFMSTPPIKSRGRWIRNTISSLLNE